ncbi:unnamed protein product, partial [Prorocentrum cordatum]
NMGLPSEIQTARCHETFRFGSDETATAKQQVAFPVWVKSAKEQIAVYLVPGRVSLLVARPCLEEWGMVADYRNEEVMYLGAQPQKWIDMETNGEGGKESEKEADFFVTSSYGDAEIEHAETVKFDAKELEDWRGEVKAEKFTLETGWVFMNGSRREAFMRGPAKKRPEEVLVAPPCASWSTIGALAEANKSSECRLQQRGERAKQQREFLKFSRDIQEAQQQAQRHAHIEHPRYATSWEAGAWCGMTGYDTFVDQCAYGLMALDSAGRRLGPIRKPTNLRTAKMQMHDGLWKTCGCKGNLVILEGGHRARG